MSERDNEILVRDALKELGIHKGAKGIKYKENGFPTPTVENLLKNAGKAGKGGIGTPDYAWLPSPNPHKIAVVIECKGPAADHASDDGKSNPVRFAVDGARHYARFLSTNYNVVAIATSGETAKTFRLSTYIHRKGAAESEPLTTPDGKPITELVSMDELTKAVTFDPEKKRLSEDYLLALSSEIHNLIRVKISESHKALLIAGTLIALKEDTYRRDILGNASDDATVWDSQSKWLDALKTSLNRVYAPNSLTPKERAEGKAKAEVIEKQLESIIDNNPSLCGAGWESKKKYRYIKKIKTTPLDTVAFALADKVFRELEENTSFDIIGNFYGEFLSYSGGDSKLGIVLTPQHITKVMCEFAGVDGTKSVVLDPCMGTGGFLIAAMNEMFKSSSDHEDVRRNRLIGIEERSDMYALGAANMIVRGDGKANVYHGSCFHEGIKQEIAERKLQPNVGIINPPYGLDDHSELDFITNMLDMLETGGIGIAIVPMSAATASSVEKAKLLKDHTLKAVMSVPKVFKGVGVHPIIMVFEAGVPHSGKPSWFALWKDDGHVVSNKVRKDTGEWANTFHDKWLKAYRRGVAVGDSVVGESVSRVVGPGDEWLAEAYIETDYSKITDETFKNVVLNYALYLRENGATDAA